MLELKTIGGVKIHSKQVYYYNAGVHMGGGGETWDIPPPPPTQNPV